MSSMTALKTELQELKAKKEAPQWFTRHALQHCKNGYYAESLGENTPRAMYERIINTIVQNLPSKLSHYKDKIKEYCYEQNFIAFPTPVLVNLGCGRGLSVSCSGGYMADNLYDIRLAQLEVSMLTKYGFGTSAYLGDLRPKNSKVVGTGGVSSGALSFMTDFVKVTDTTSQGARRGAGAWYIGADHPEAADWLDYVRKYPDLVNIGINYDTAFLNRLQQGDTEALELRKKHLLTRAKTGRGYFFYTDKANADLPDYMKQQGLKVHASNLCTEIMLPSNSELTFTCILLSLNLAEYANWPDDLEEVALVIQEGIINEFLHKAAGVKGLEKAHLYTNLYRSVGVGVIGWHTYLQSIDVAFEDLQSLFITRQIFSRFQDNLNEANKKLGALLGTPAGIPSKVGHRFSHVSAIAPTTTTSIFCGSVSRGIEPYVGNIYTENSAKGKMERMNPIFVKLAKKLGKYSAALKKDIIDHNGSVQHLDWLTDQQKRVFKTAFEIDQRWIVRLADARQQYIDQGQSVNLFLPAGTDSQYFAEVHELADKLPRLKSLYYVRSTKEELRINYSCEQCEG